MYPRCWLPRRSKWMEYNQCRSLSHFGSQVFQSIFLSTTQSNSDADCPPSSFVFSTRNVDKPVHDSLATASCLAFTALLHELRNSFETNALRSKIPSSYRYAPLPAQ